MTIRKYLFTGTVSALALVSLAFAAQATEEIKGGGAGAAASMAPTPTAVTQAMHDNAAKDQLTGQSVAVKKIMKPFSTPVLAKRTYRELKLLKHLRHENVSMTMPTSIQDTDVSGHFSERHLHISPGRHLLPMASRTALSSI